MPTLTRNQVAELLDDNERLDSWHSIIAVSIRVHESNERLLEFRLSKDSSDEFHIIDFYTYRRVPCAIVWKKGNMKKEKGESKKEFEKTLLKFLASQFLRR